MDNICYYYDNKDGLYKHIHNHSGSCSHNHDYELNNDHSHSLHIFTETFQSEKKLKLAFLLTLLILAIELLGAILSKSMALYAESGHVLVDASSLFLAWFAQIQVRKSPSEKNTYGYHRIGILAALLNSLLLLMLSAVLIYEGYLRLMHPEKINSDIMIIFPLISLMINIFIGFKIHGGIHHNLNLKSSFFHILGDSLVSLSIIAGGIIIYLTGYYYVDPIISLMISPLLALGAFSVINETLNILLEGVPKEIDFAEVKEEILKTPGVKNVHDLHIWSMSKSFKLMSAHVLVEPTAVKSSDICCIINNIQDIMEEKFKIRHTVIQPEISACDAANDFCTHKNL